MQKWGVKVLHVRDLGGGGNFCTFEIQGGSTFAYPENPKITHFCREFPYKSPGKGGGVSFLKFRI